jgi:hypothetical protein
LGRLILGLGQKYGMKHFPESLRAQQGFLCARRICPGLTAKPLRVILVYQSDAFGPSSQVSVGLETVRSPPISPSIDGVHEIQTRVTSEKPNLRNALRFVHRQDIGTGNEKRK